MNDKIPSGRAPKRPNEPSSKGVESAEKKSKTGQTPAVQGALENKIKRKLDDIKANSTPFFPNTKLDSYRSHALKIPDWMKGSRPKMAEITANNDETDSLPSTEEEWAKLEKDLKQREFEIFGKRSR